VRREAEERWKLRCSRALECTYTRKGIEIGLLAPRPADVKEGGIRLDEREIIMFCMFALTQKHIASEGAACCALEFSKY